MRLRALGLCWLLLAHALPVRADDVLVFSAGLDVLGGTLGTLFGAEERGGIHIVRPDGTGLRQLTSFQTLNFRYEPDVFHLPDDHPTVSPDGKHLLFSSSRADDDGILGGIVGDDDFDVFVMRVNGTNLRRLTRFPGFDGEAAFSPDGTRIAFVSQCAGLPATPCLAHPNVFVMDLNGTVLHRVTTSPFSDVEPAWSPDGTKIVYTRVTDEGTVIFGDEQKHMRIVDADGSNDRLLFDRPKQDHDASFHPNGGSIVITSEVENTFPYGDVVRVAVPGGQLLANLTVDDTFLGVGGGGDPAWSPDGTQIAYIKATLGILRGPQKIHLMNANGTGKRKLDAGFPGLLNIHQNWGVVADSDGDGTPDYLENGNVSFTREAVTGFGLFGQQVATRSQPGESFGAAIALADLTHDGRPDLVIGSPGLDDGGVIPDSGGVAIVRGTALGPQFSPTLAESLSTVLERLATVRPIPTANGRFGQTLASADLNADGFTDVAIGAPGQNRVLVLYGGLASQVLSGTGQFGSALATGDFNLDGRADLAVGAPFDARTVAGQPVAAGSVRVFYGVAGGLSPSPQVFDQGSFPLAAGIGAVEAGDRFGAALAAGDVDGSAGVDLVIGVPGEDVDGVADAGLFHVVPGRLGQPLAPGLAVHRDARSLPPPFGALQAGAQLGSVVAVGRFTGGSLGVRNVVVGAPDQDVGTTGRLAFSVTSQTNAGIVAVFDGRSPLLAGSDPLGTTVRVLTAESVGDAPRAAARFGQSFATGDLTGDGVRDLAIGAPGQLAGGVAQAGAVFLVPGNSTSNDPFACIPCGGGGLVPAAAQRVDQASVFTVRETGDRFGGSLAAGDMDGDGQDDLFIGSPQEDGSGADTGLVSIRYGIDVGTFDLVPATVAVDAGDAVTLTLTWAHPEQWRQLETLHLRLVDDERTLFWVRYDVQTNLFDLVEHDPRGRPRKRAPGAPGFLREPLVALALADSAVTDSGPQGRTITLALPLRIARRVPSGTLRVEVLATDVHGNGQGFEQAGTLHVR